MLRPCQNNGTCMNMNNSQTVSYECQCLSGYNGTDCEIDLRPCTPSTCWNNGELNWSWNIEKEHQLVGLCQPFVSSNLSCSCGSGWQGSHCQALINYCRENSCLNGGICRPLLLGYQCLCLSDFSGESCEMTSRKTETLQIVSKSFAYVAITAICLVFLITVVFDILKYVFGMDLVRVELQKIRKKKIKKKPVAAVIQRFHYVPWSLFYLNAHK